MTNNALDKPAGTENYIRDVAIALLRAGHYPWCYSQTLGTVREKLRDAGVPVFDDLGQLPGEPDVIHGHHRLETTVAGLRFPTVPVISFCHAPKLWQEAPCRLPNVVAWIAVDTTSKARLVDEDGIPADKVHVLMGFVDTMRFPLRTPLPPKPNRALVFSNYASDETHVPVLRKVCESRGIALDVIGSKSRNLQNEPEDLLFQYDLVFAKARSALEAMASGCAVVECDYFGAGRLVTTDNFDEIRPLNFGLESLTYPLDAGHIGAEVDKYDADDARALSVRVRAECSLQVTFPKLLEQYEKAVAQRDQLREAGMSRAGSEFAESELKFMKNGRRVEVVTDLNASLRVELADKRKTLRAVRTELNEVNTKLTAANAKLTAANAKLTEAQSNNEQLRQQLTKAREAIRVAQSSGQESRRQLRQARKEIRVAQSGDQALRRRLKRARKEIREIHDLPWWKRLAMSRHRAKTHRRRDPLTRISNESVPE